VKPRSRRFARGFVYEETRLPGLSRSRVPLSWGLISAANEVTPARVANLDCRPDSTSDNVRCSRDQVYPRGLNEIESEWLFPMSPNGTSGFPPDVAIQTARQQLTMLFISISDRLHLKQ
jgi:hypothetical protein